MNDAGVQVTISLKRYEQLLKHENALKSNKKVVVITSYDGYSSGTIAVESEAWDEIEEKLKDQIEDYWETLNASGDYDPKDETPTSIFGALFRCATK